MARAKRKTDDVPATSGDDTEGAVTQPDIIVPPAKPKAPKNYLQCYIAGTYENDYSQVKPYIFRHTATQEAAATLGMLGSFKDSMRSSGSLTHALFEEAYPDFRRLITHNIQE